MSAEVFVKLLEYVQKQMKSTLLMDNQKTHVILDTNNYCRENPRTGYSLWTSVSTARFYWSYFNESGKAISICDIAKLTSQPYLLSFIPINIIKSFKKAGIWPIYSLNFDGVLNYGPSTSLQADSNYVPLESLVASYEHGINDLDHIHTQKI